jgi:exosortase/archaeosortase family protein
MSISKGLRQFAMRTLAFGLILIASYLFVFLYFRHTPFFASYLRVGEEFYFDFLTGLRKTDFLNSVLFTAVLMTLWNRDRLTKLRTYMQNWSQTIIFGSLAIMSQVGHYAFKYWINTNQDIALGNTVLMTLVKYGFNIVFVVFLGIAVYNTGFVKEQFSKYKSQLPVFAILGIFYFFIIQAFQSIWKYLSNFVAGSIYHMLNLTFDNVYMRPATDAGPVLGVGQFIVGISKECSGIDSLLLFISLYSVILILDWNRLNRKRMLLLFIPGILGTVLYNLLRVYAIMLVGILYDPKFAVDVFHTNAGWVLFLVFFMIFWHFGSSWVYRKKTKPKNSGIEFH